MDSVKGCWNAAAAVLEQQAVTSVFGLPGDDLDALAALTGAGIDFTVCRDQRNALFMTTGYALASGRTGVAVLGKGPALTNAVTGLLEAACSAAPVVLLSGGTSQQQRGSRAFQELDQVAVLAPVVKWAARVDHPDRLVPMLRKAFLVAKAGPPGPVYLELPDHLLEAEFTLPAERPGPVETPAVTVGEDSAALAALRTARRPVVLVGGGMRHRNDGRRVERFAEAFGAPVFCTATGRGAVDESLPLFCGLAGLYTPEAAMPLWTDADCVIALGSRLEETAVHRWPDRIGRDVPVIQVNLTEAEFAPDYSGPKVVGDAGAVLDAWLAHGSEGTGEWAARAREIHAALHEEQRTTLAELRAKPEPHIAEVLDALARVVPEDRVLVQENGLQDMWSYRFPRWTCAGDGGSVVPSEQTSLGFGAAATLGVKIAVGDRPVVALIGDGAFAMVDSDLPTAAAVSKRLASGVLYVVLRNGGYGWLQAQLDNRAEPVPGHSFVEPAGGGGGDTPAGGGPAGVRRFTLADKDKLDADVAEAWRVCATGQVVVLDVPVRLDDAWFGAEQAGGDFPVLPE